MTKFKAIAAACGALFLLIGSAKGGPVSNKVITWGENAPEWNRILHLGGTRFGCSDAPSSCANEAQRVSKAQGVDKVFVAVLLKRDQTPAYMREFSQLSMNHPALYEVGFDDFVGQCEKQKMNMPAMSALLSDIAQGVKSINPKLRFGITVYEDELWSSEFSLSGLDEGFRKSVDFVHLYPHYRKEAKAFLAAVERARQIFPASKIIAGIYAYDRRDYLPCTRGGTMPCTNQEEISLFEQSLKERLSAVGNSEVEWAEFYPGNFGGEAQWQLWSQPRICRQERLQECIQNTKAMREVVKRALNP
jgi:hypothetical protein